MSTTDRSNYDVFVSYAHADNATGWVESLIKLMTIKVQEALGREPRFFFDPKIKIGTEVPQELADSASSSGILLIILSPSYLASEWCRRELQHFIANRKSRNQNVFVVEAEKVPRDRWHAELVDLETREMYDTASDPPLRLDPRLGPEVEARFTRNTQAIGYAIAERLALVPPPPAKGAVWVAPVTDDLRQQRRDLVEMVKQAKWTVLPALPYKRDDEIVFTQALEKDLAEAQMFVQLLGPWSGENPEWSTLSFPELHANAARDVAKSRRVPSLLWRKSPLPTEESASYRALVSDGTVQESTPGDFAKEVLRILKDLSTPPPPADPPQIVPGHDNGEAPVSVYFDNAEQDSEMTERIKASLVTMNVDIVIPAPHRAEASPAQRRRNEAGPARLCHGAILVHGAMNDEWVQSKFIYLRQKLRPNRLIGVFKAPPPPKQDVIVSLAMRPVDCQAGFDEQKLREFIAQVRQQQGDEEYDDA